MKIHVYLIRHGQTDWNLVGRFQGIEDIPLNQTGRKQALECGEILQQTHIPFDCILTSPLCRARETAEILGNALGLPNIQIEENLKERDFGKISGLLPEDREALVASKKPTGAEEWRVAGARLKEVLNRYCMEEDNQKYQHILVVSHGASINCFLSLISDKQVGAGRTVLKNTCLSTLSIDGDTFFIENYNLSPEEFGEMYKNT